MEALEYISVLREASQEKNTWFEGLRQKKLSILWFSDGTGANGGEHCGVQAKWDDQVLCFYHRSYKPGDMIHGLNKQQYGLVYLEETGKKENI